MQLIVSVCLFVSLMSPFIEVKSFRIGDFFFGNTNDAVDTASLMPSDEHLNERSLNASTAFPSFNEDELYSTSLNSSFSEELRKSDAWNSSESFGLIQNNSILNAAFDESNVTAKESVKKELSQMIFPTSTDESSTIASEQDGVITTSANGANGTSNTDEHEEVVLGTTKATVVELEKTIFQKSIDWVKDTYTLSILIPVAAGVLFATTCILTIVLCRYMRRCCRRRRFRRKVLPDSIKSLRSSDHARLLGDCSSDEEF